jgi:hypothetical protein
MFWGTLMMLRISLLCLALSFSLPPVCAQSTQSYDSLVQEGNRQLQAGNLRSLCAGRLIWWAMDELPDGSVWETGWR